LPEGGVHPTALPTKTTAPDAAIHLPMRPDFRIQLITHLKKLIAIPFLQL
jgi:hypothetical protein